MKCKDCQFYEKDKNSKDTDEKSHGVCNLNFELEHTTDSEQQCSDWCEWVQKAMKDREDK